MTDILSLEQLVHLSLGDPEAGAVNFNVLKTLLLQMLKAMNLYNYKPTMSDDDQRTVKEALTTSPKPQVTFEQDQQSTSDTENETKKKSRRKKRDRSSDRLNSIEEKVFRFESQLNALNQIPSNSELIDRAKQMPKKTADHDDQGKTTGRHGPILEVWQYTQRSHSNITEITLGNSGLQGTSTPYRLQKISHLLHSYMIRNNDVYHCRVDARNVSIVLY